MIIPDGKEETLSCLELRFWYLPSAVQPLWTCAGCRRDGYSLLPANLLYDHPWPLFM